MTTPASPRILNADSIASGEKAARNRSPISRSESEGTGSEGRQRDWDPFIVWQNLIKQDKGCA